MRALSIAGLILAVALVAGAGLSRGAETQVPVPPGTPSVLTGYRLTAQLEASLFVGWSDTQGDRDADCSSWSIHTGTSRVEAHTGRIPGFIQLYRPGTTHVVIRGRRIPVTWAELSAVGPGSGIAKRTYTHDAGVNWSAACGGSRPQPERVPEPDCRPRTFTTRTASIVATNRRGDFNTLELGDANPGGIGARVRSIDFYIAPARDLFRTCPSAKIADTVGRYARRYITDVGLAIGGDGWSKLRRLGRGQRTQLHHQFGGRCETHISPRECSFRLALDVWITRVG